MPWWLMKLFGKSNITGMRHCVDSMPCRLQEVWLWWWENLLFWSTMRWCICTRYRQKPMCWWVYIYTFSCNIWLLTCFIFLLHFLLYYCVHFKAFCNCFHIIIWYPFSPVDFYWTSLMAYVILESISVFGTFKRVDCPS